MEATILAAEERHPLTRQATRDTEFFQQIKQLIVPWRNKSVPFPAFYYDVGSIEAGFLALTERVEAILPSRRMHPFRISPGHCLVVIAAMAYRDSDIGPYNEVLIGIPFTLDTPSPLFTGTLRRPPEAPLVYVHRLPVTTEIAMQGGNDFLAAPKFLADITFEESEEWLRCHLAEDEAPILTLAVRKGELKHTGRSRASLVTVQEGYLLRWEFIESEQEKSSSHSAADARLQLGTHPLAQELGKLQLGKVVSAEYKPQFQTILGPVMESFKG